MNKIKYLSYFCSMLLLGLALSVQAQITFRAAAQASSAAGAGGGGAISFVAAGAQTAGTGVSIIPVIPGGTLAGDFAVLIVAGRPADTSEPVAPAGWLLRSSVLREAGASDLKIMTFYRFLAGGDANPTIVLPVNWQGNARGMSGQIAVWRGVDATTPFDVADITGTSAAVRDWTPPAITTVTDGAWAVSAVASSDNNGLIVNAANGFTGRMTGTNYDSTVGGDHVIGLADEVQVTAGTVTMLQWRQSVNFNDPWAGITFALRPIPPVLDTLTVNVPAGTAAGDVMIASITVRPCSNVSGGACTVSIIPPGGWTLVRQIDQPVGGGTGGFGNLLAVYQRVATGAEPVSYTWNFAGTPVHAGAVGAISSYAGVDVANPIVVENGQTTPNALNHTTPDIDTGTVVNTMLVSSHVSNSSGTWTPPTAPLPGMTEVADGASLPPTNDLGIMLEVNYEARAAGGATGTRMATQSNPPASDAGATHMLALRPAPMLNHFSIFHAGSGVACDVHTITINAHNALHVLVSAGGLTVNLSTSNNRGTWTGIAAGGGTLSDPTPGNGTATYTFAAGSSSVQLLFRYANLAATSETFSFNVSGGGFSETTGTASQAGDDPNFTMAQAGFRFRNIEDNNSTILTQLSGKPSNTGFNARTVRLQAIRTDNTTGSCTGLFASQSRSVEIGAECNNPVACAARQVSINGANIATSNDNAAAGAAAYTGVSLAFNANSEADTVIAYPDAGLMTLHARFDLDADVAGFEMTGASNPFVVRPFGLRVSGVTTSAAPAPADPVFVKAGQDFNATLTAVLWKAGDDANADGVPDNDAQIAGNAATPNFGQEASAATALLTHTLNAPAGGAAGTLGGATTYTGFVTGGKTQAVNWSEVGFINLFAQSTNYLGGGQNVTNAATGLTGVGRFIPDHFIVTPGTLTNRQGLACAPASTFTYEGEPFRVTFMLTARNALAAPTVTTNYATANTYARLDGTVPANFGFGAVDLADLTPPLPATALTTRLAPGTSSGTWLAGTGNFTADVTVNRAVAPDGPFESFRLGVLPVDLDNVTLRIADLDLDTDVPANVNDRVSVGSTKIRFGRLRLGNISGSALLPLRMPMEAQYWNGTFFVTNTDDSCTAPAPANVGLGNAIGGITTSVTAVSALTSGRGTITLAPPAGGNRGSIDVAVNLGPVPPGTATADACPAAPAAFAPAATAANRAYLRGNWCNPPGTYTKDPSARARFGIARGSEETIYFRENF